MMSVRLSDAPHRFTLRGADWSRAHLLFGLSDLRMGLTPNYVFRFIIAEHAGDRFEPVAPRRVPGDRQADGDWEWLYATFSGIAMVRPAEAARQADAS